MLVKRHDTSTVSNELRARIKRYIHEHGISPGKFSKRAGISYSYTRMFLSGEIKAPGMDQLTKIEEVLRDAGI